MKLKPCLLAAAVLALASHLAHAHRVWILPSTTVLSGESPWVTFDACVSNNLFFPNYVPLPTDPLVAVGPDGKPVTLQNPSTGKLRSTFDLELAKEGSYQIYGLRSGISAHWKEDGENKRWRGDMAKLKAEGITKKPDVGIYNYIRRTATFVTAGKPNKEALKPLGKGLELVVTDTHPNDLFAGEKATFTMHLNGKPAPEVDVVLIKGGDRFRNDPEEIKIKTDSEGKFSITLKEAGRYWMEAVIEKKSGELDGAPLYDYATYAVTLEVLPE
ncbi:DUF4198 domain-containing protein [Verrucomicrobiaceae bacterium R5-34]|uniref:DUF4198 domain-containing protein n=1 Tax=Oceaniferula flava TaxID=2800421 RepID=A0AAE2SB62_9BACT|nr:DUF4198 domain-containing protein [Oceaniferula flavus]MBK1832260.1 DUF4198 domain-containing protein [Verrucomicrobiaceae bacterium R5-34]MBK1854900.1 DUF4198 domain-containing protein [Oceaniferula flavus]MBM1136206.1 DUF4198 domain-containing protein [Oceaniferula flavus]